MKRKIIMAFSVVFAFAIVILVQPVQSFAIEALSIFRVGDMKTLKITVADLQEIMQNLNELDSKVLDMNIQHSTIEEEKFETRKSEIIKLENAKDFDAFSLKLPQELKEQTPEILAVNPDTVKFTLNTQICNEILLKMKSEKLLSDTFNGVEMSIMSPPSVLAQYEDMLFFATQKPAFVAPEDVKDELQEIMLQIPLIPQNIREQLAQIDMDSNDIYLPVLVGVGRELDLGGKMGYIYKMSDLEAFIQTLPKELMDNTTAYNYDLKEDISVLLWTKDGILYGLMGNTSDSELASIARSVR